MREANWISIVEPGGRIIGAINLDVHAELGPPYHRRSTMARLLSSPPERLPLDAAISSTFVNDRVPLVWCELEIYSGMSPVNRWAQWFLMPTKDGVPDHAWKTDGWIDLRNAFKDR